VDINASNFYQALDTFKVLHDKISTVDEAAFKEVFGSVIAGSEKGILYVFRTEKPIPRLKGVSDVLYIGQTKGSLKQRYLINSAKLANSKANRLKFEHIVSEYGPIRITYAPFSKYGKNLINAEGQLLWWYFQNHCEYPPINYTQTKVRNDRVSVVSF